MRLFRRLFRWATFFGFLVAVGAVVFLEVRYRPRCTIAGDYRFLQSSPDGATVVTATIPDDEQGTTSGSVQVWDTHTGLVRFTFLDVIDAPDLALSPDMRLMATVAGDGTIRVLDCHNGAEKSLPLAVPRVGLPVGFSSKGHWLFAHSAKEKPADFFIQVSSGRCVRRPGLVDFSTNDNTILIREELEKAITVWDLEVGKELGALATTEGPWRQFSRDGRYFLNSKFVRDEGNAAASKDPTRRLDRAVEIWDLTTFTKHYSHVYRDQYFLSASLSASGRHAMIRKSTGKDENRVDVVDTDTGHTVLTIAMESYYHDFSTDGKLLCVSDRNKRTAMIDLTSGQTLWEKPSHGAVQFAGATGVLLYLDEKIAVKPAELLNVRTGEGLAVVPLLSRDPNPYGKGLDTRLPRLTADCRHLLAVGMQPRPHPPYFWERWLARWWPARFGSDDSGMAVMETSSGKVLFQVRKGAGDQQFLSNDGATLTTVEGFAVIRVWDVHPGRAWLWAFAFAVGTGVGLWCLRIVVGWLHGRRFAIRDQR
jgi:WD40 repeat protein